MARKRGRPSAPSPRVPVPSWNPKKFARALEVADVDRLVYESGIGRKTLEAWARSTNVPRADYLAVVAHLLGVSMEAWFDPPPRR